MEKKVNAGITLVEKYLAAIGGNLPLRSRGEIKRELRANLLDEIEAKFGSGATEEQICSAIEAFGSPSEVASRYKGDEPVIGAGLIDVYFLVLKTMLGGLAIAFTVVFIIGLVETNPRGDDLLRAILKVPLNIFTAGLSGTGAVTLVFMVLTRRFRNRKIEADSAWSAKELQSVEIEGKEESLLESVFSIIFFFACAILLSVYPGIVSAAERMFGVTGISLGHTINVNVFKYFIPFMLALWGSEIVVQVYVMKKGKNDAVGYIRAAESILGIILMAVMLLSKDLYAVNTGIIGFKLIFLILIAVNFAETIGFAVKMIKRKIESA